MEVHKCRSMAEDDLDREATRSLLASAENGEEETYETFDDRNFGLYKKFTGIRIRSGYVVDAIQFVYNKDECTTWYGGPGGSMSEFFFKEGEYITQVDWLTGMWEDYPLEVMAYVSFRTNLGREFSAGKKDKCREIKSYYFSDDGKCYQSFSGKYDRYFLGFDLAYQRPIGVLRFNDALYVQNRLRVTEIRLNAGWVVDGIQFVYDGNKETHYHGGMGGTRTTLKLQKDEYITSISGKTGNYQYQGGDTLCHLEIWTNKGNSISGGSTQGCSDMKDFSYEAEKGEQIFALRGKYSSYMRKLWVGMYASEGELPETGADVLDAEVSIIGGKNPRKCMSLQGLQGGSLEGAVKGGCFNKEELRSMVEKTLDATEEGSVCRREIEARAQQIQETYLTRQYVNTLQYVFRGPTIPREQEYIMENRKILSKAQKRQNLLKPIIKVDSQNTEQYEYSMVLRALAIKSSDVPPSQFVSHALDYATAERFAARGKCVFAYKLVPNSPLLGFKKEGVVGEGEDQFQILGGTEITKLFRFIDEHWEQYDFTAKAWSKTGKRPINKEYEMLRGDYMGEL